MDETKSEGTCLDVAGVWSRLFEEDPIGDIDGADRTTLVYWLQVPTTGTYIDLRLPKDSLGRYENSNSREANSITKSPTSLLGRQFQLSGGDEADSIHGVHWNILCNQKSFAGKLTYCKGDASTTSHGQALKTDEVLADYVKADPTSLCTCYWKRYIDYQPPTGGLDIGICATDPATVPSSKATNGNIDIRETGDDGSYAEGWRRLADTSNGPFFAMEMLSEDSIENARNGYWIRVGNHFAYAIGRPTTENFARELYCSKSSWRLNNDNRIVGQLLKDAVEILTTEESDAEMKMQEQMAIVGSYVCCIGKVNDDSDGDGRKWKIQHSTHPELVGCHLLGGQNEVDRGKHNTSRCCSWIDSSDVRGAADKSKLEVGTTIVQHVVTGNLPSTSIQRQWKIVEVSYDSNGKNALSDMFLGFC